MDSLDNITEVPGGLGYWEIVYFFKDPTLSGAGEDCFRGLYLEVSLALVGVASPA